MRQSQTFIAAITALGLSLAAPGAAPAAGFDCKQADTRVEKLICADPGLSRLDNEMARDFEAIRQETGGVDGQTGKASFPFGAEQTRWRASVRDKCRDAACLTAAYEARLAKVRADWKGVLANP
jgi:uncharacterized protein